MEGEILNNNIPNVSGNFQNVRTVNINNTNEIGDELTRRTTANTPRFKTNNTERGRIAKRNKNLIKGKHNNKAPDNSRKRLANLCAKSLDNFIRNKASKYKVKLNVLTISKQFGKNLKENEEFLNKKIINIYFDSTPKRCTEKNRYNNIEKIQYILRQERLGTDTTKILDVLFSLDFKQIFQMFLLDKTVLSYSNDSVPPININLEEFKTFQDQKEFQTEDFDEESIKKIKKNALKFINGEISHREKKK